MRRWSRSTAAGRRGALAADLGGRGPLRRRARSGPRDRSSIAHPAAERHRASCTSATRSSSRSRTRSCGGTGCAGLNTLFQPGFDHAGHLDPDRGREAARRQGKTRQELGREGFEARVWDWLREYGGTIMLQFRRMGASMDYRRERFTMDDAYVARGDALLRPPVRQGLDLPRNRIINWCPFHETSLSDLEVVHERGRRRARLRPLPARRRRRATSRSRPRGRRRSWPTSPSPCTRTTSATATSSAGR